MRTGPGQLLTDKRVASSNLSIQKWRSHVAALSVSSVAPLRAKIGVLHLVINLEKAHNTCPITTSELILHSAF